MSISNFVHNGSQFCVLKKTVPCFLLTLMMNTIMTRRNIAMNEMVSMTEMMTTRRTMLMSTAGNRLSAYAYHFLNIEYINASLYTIH